MDRANSSQPCQNGAKRLNAWPLPPPFPHFPPISFWAFPIAGSKGSYRDSGFGQRTIGQQQTAVFRWTECGNRKIIWQYHEPWRHETWEVRCHMCWIRRRCTSLHCESGIYAMLQWILNFAVHQNNERNLKKKSPDVQAPLTNNSMFPREQLQKLYAY